jgi:hypothetical protein
VTMALTWFEARDVFANSDGVKQDGGSAVATCRKNYVWSTVYELSILYSIRVYEIF